MALLDLRILTSQGPRSIEIEVSRSAFLKISCSFFVYQRYGFVARAVICGDVCYHAIRNLYGNLEPKTKLTHLFGYYFLISAFLIDK